MGAFCIGQLTSPVWEIGWSSFGMRPANPHVIDGHHASDMDFARLAELQPTKFAPADLVT
jgi:hypothetical protein